MYSIVDDKQDSSHSTRSVTIRIAIDARLVGGSNTGDSTYWTCLVTALAQTRPDLQLLLFSNAERPESVPDLPNTQWIHLPAKSTRFWSWVAFPLAARKRGAELIHTQYSLSPLVGNRGIVTVHDVSFFVGPQWFSSKDRFLLQQAVPSACLRAKRILAVSQTTQREISQYIPGVTSKIVVTPNACPPWIHRVDEQTYNEVLARLGVKTPYLLTVGTRWARKNMELAVESVNLLPTRFPHQLIITGKPGAHSESVGTRGHTTGYVSTEDLCALYSGATAYLAPSHHEGFGIPVLEAFRTGCPVVSSSGGALPEVVGEAGEVIESWKAYDWATQLENLLDDPSKLKQMSQRGLEREKVFSWTNTANLTVRAYREALT